MTSTPRAATPPIPVILDTDLGDDIDDTWALIQLLRCPELDLQLLTTAFRDTHYRARLACKLLQAAGRGDVPVGIGPRSEDYAGGGRQADWIADYPLSRYPGPIHTDGVQALIDAIRGSARTITLLAIGPLTNIAEALRRAPDIAARTRLVGMQGAVYCGYNGKPEVAAEWNVRADIASAQAVFAAPWQSVVLTPLDTCGTVVLRADHYRALSAAPQPAVQAIIANDAAWRASGTPPAGPGTASTILFDTVAVHLAYSTRWLKMAELGLRVTDDGFTRPDPAARPMQIAVDWLDRDAFEADLTRRLLA